MTIPQADALYRAAEYCQITRETVSHEGVRELTNAVRNFVRSLPDTADNPLWIPAARRAKRLRWELNSAPIPFSSTALGLAESADFIGRALRKLELTSGDVAVEHLVTIRDITRALAAVQDNPLGYCAAEILEMRDPSRSALITRRPELAPDVENWLKSAGLGRVAVVSEDELRASAPFETVVAIGAARWYGSHLLTAPRAEHICLVHFSWVGDSDTVTGLLGGAQSRKVERPIRRSHVTTGISIEASEFLPSVDWAAIADSSRSAVGEADGGDEVPARLFLLADGCAVYLEGAEESKSWVIDPSADHSHRVRRERVRSLEPGMFVLLRSARGGEDYIRAMADRRLGREAPRLRELQAEWKRALRQKVHQVGLTGVADQLWKNGLKRRPQNVRYWLFPDTIRTATSNDFKLLMEYVGFGHRWLEIWTAMEKIHSAHIWAGGEIRRLLEAQVLSAPLDKLLHTGLLGFELKGADAGSLTIFRIDAANPETVPVPPSWLNWPQKVEDDLWRG